MLYVIYVRLCWRKSLNTQDPEDLTFGNLVEIVDLKL